MTYRLKRIIAAVLLAAVLISSFASCGDGGGETQSSTTLAGDTKTSAEETTVAPISDDLPQKDYGGYTFMIYNTNVKDNVWFTTTSYTQKEDSGDTIDSAIYRRNLKVEERFNVKIEEFESTTSQVTKAITAGDDTFSMAMLTGVNVISAAQKGMLHDLSSLEYIDLTKPWWDANATEMLSFMHKNYMGVSDFDTSHVDETIVTFFNKQLVKDFALEDPYKLVSDKAWTYDKVGEMGKKVIADLNGDSVMDDNDRYAYMSWNGVLYPYMLLSSGETYMKKNDDDIPYISADSDRFVSVYETVVNLMHGEGDTFFYDAGKKKNTKGLSSDHRVQEIMFPNNQALFWSECVSWSKALRDMECDFGIIPSPMMNDGQDQYLNYCNCNFYGITIPSTTKDVDRTSIITEALSSASTDTVVSAYYYITLKTKYARDEQSAEMLDMIFGNLVYDIGAIFFGTTIKDSITGIAASNSLDIASTVAKKQESVNKTIDKIVASFQG